jgi:hypothetical protein
LGNSWGYGMAVVDILPDDVGFASMGCGTWEPFEPPAEPLTSFPAGQYVVGDQIVPGRYVSEGGSDADCFWNRVADFTGSQEASLDLQLGGAREVDVLPTDGGFITVDCGTWTLE